MKKEELIKLLNEKVSGDYVKIHTKRLIEHLKKDFNYDDEDIIEFLEDPDELSDYSHLLTYYDMEEHLSKDVYNSIINDYHNLDEANSIADDIFKEAIEESKKSAQK